MSALSETESSSIQRLSAFVTLGAFAMLIFWHLPGLTAFEGDDYCHTSWFPFCHYPHLPGSIGEYLAFISQGRGFLHWAYHEAYMIGQQNLDVAVWAFVLVYIGSCFVLYLVLARFLSAPAALAGSLLYLAHGMKYHAVLIYNSQIYVPVVLAAILIGAVLTSRLSRGVQCILCTALYWVSIHFYEVLMILVPLFPIIWLAPSLGRRTVPSWRDILYSFTPALVTVLHIAILASVAKPIWAGKTEPGASLNLIALFGSGLQQSIGPYHWLTVKQCIGSFFKFDVRADHSLWIPLLLALGGLSFSLSLICRLGSLDKEQKSSQPALCLGTLMSGLYIALLGPMIAVAEYSHYVPSRLMLLPSLGLALAVASALDLIGDARAYRWTASLVLIWCFCETVAFSDMVQQFIDAASFDKKMTNSIMSLKLPSLVGKQLYLSLPFTKRKDKYWHQGLPSYYCSQDPIRLWEACHHGLNPFTYYPVMREPGSLTPGGLADWVRSRLKQHSPSELYPLYMDDNGVIRAITTVTISDAQGKVESEIKTGLSGIVEPRSSMSVSVAAAGKQFHPF